MEYVNVRDYFNHVYCQNFPYCKNLPILSTQTDHHILLDCVNQLCNPLYFLCYKTVVSTETILCS